MPRATGKWEDDDDEEEKSAQLGPPPPIDFDGSLTSPPPSPHVHPAHLGDGATSSRCRTTTTPLPPTGHVELACPTTPFRSSPCTARFSCPPHEEPPRDCPHTSHNSIKDCRLSTAKAVPNLPTTILFNVFDDVKRIVFYCVPRADKTSSSCIRIMHASRITGTNSGH